MTIEGRMTVCNMAIEAGARAGLVAYDHTTETYIKNRPFAPVGDQWFTAKNQWENLKSDKEAKFDKEIEIDGSLIAPQVTWGTSPEMVIDIDGLIPMPDSESIQHALDYMDLEPGKKIKDIKLDQVFIGSCMTNIGHFRAASKLLKKYNETKARLWVVPPTKMDEEQLIEEGEYKIFQDLGARTELPGCSLCMGNQARVLANSTVISTSTRNFPNRMGDGADVFLASAELSAVTAILGKIPTVDEYHQYMNDINPFSENIYRYLNFNEIESYVQSANSADIPAINIINPN